MQLGTGRRAFSKIEKQEKTRNERQRREIDEMKRLLPDRLNDPLLDVGMASHLHRESPPCGLSFTGSHRPVKDLWVHDLHITGGQHVTQSSGGAQQHGPGAEICSATLL